MGGVFKNLWSVLHTAERKRFVWLLVAIIGMGLFEVLGIASILPFMQLVSQPETIQTNETAAWIYEALGFTSNQSFLIATGVAVLVLLASSNFITVMTKWLQQLFAWRTVHELSIRLLEIYIYQPYPFFLKNNSSELGKQVLSEINGLANTVLLQSVEFIARTFVSTVIFTLLIVVNPQLAITVFLILGGVYVIIYFGVRKYLRKLGVIRFKANQLRYKMSNEALGNIKSIKIKGSERYFLNRFVPASETFSRVMPKSKVIALAPLYFVQTLAFGGIILIVLFLLTSSGNPQEAIPILSLYILAGYRLLPSLQSVFSAASTLRYSLPVIESIQNDLRLVEEAEIPDTTTQTPLTFEKEVRLKDLSFKYPGTDEAVLKHINLTIPKNSRVAFVGPTGSGKTTLVDLIIGLLRPTSGEVCIDGEPLSASNVRSWQAHAGYVPQEAMFFDDTITRNIVFGTEDEEVSLERVKHVARIANIHTFIEDELPDGYDTVVGERGVRLSGGQRQRIGLARAFYHNPEVLILDEATSALDGITENAVMDAIDQMGHGVTMIMIAHRLATVQDCDLIYLMEDGQIVAVGTYDELIEQNAMFREMARVVS